MCFICGNENHHGLDLIEKAYGPKPEGKRELPRYELQAKLEANFKKEYAKNIGNMITEIINNFDDDVQPKTD